MSFDIIYDELMENAQPMVETDSFKPSTTRVAFDGTQLLCQIAQQSESWLYGCCTPDIVAFVKKQVDNMLAKFKSVTIVFDGMVKDTPLLVEKNGPTYAGFLAAEGNLSSSAFDRLKKLTHPPFPNEEFVQTLFTKLQTMYANNTNFNIMRAPFFSIAQMAYLLTCTEVDMLIGSIELFSFGISPILIQNELDFSVVTCNKNFEQTLRDHHGDVLDSTILLPLRHFHTIREMYREHHNEADCSVLSLLRSCPVLKLNNNQQMSVGPFSPQESASKMAVCVYGHKCFLNDIVLLAGGLLPPSVLRTISHRVLETPQMLFSPDVKEKYADDFRSTYTFLTPLHLQIVHQALGEESDISIRVPSGEGEYSNNNVPPIQLDEWEIPEECLREGTDWVRKLKLLASKATQSKYSFTHQAAAIAAKMKLLDLMGYFTHATSPNEVSNPSVFAEALLKFANQHTVKTAVLFIEACRTKTLDWDKGNNDAELRIFATQVLSMFPLRVTDEPPRLKTISVPVFRFNMRLRSVFMALRELNMVLAMRTGSKDNPADFAREAMIFDDPPSPMMGYVAQEILGSKPVTSMEQLKERFPTANHLEEDLCAALDQLKMLCNIADELSKPDAEDHTGDEDPPITVKQPMEDSQRLFVKALEKLIPKSTENVRGTGKYNNKR